MMRAAADASRFLQAGNPHIGHSYIMKTITRLAPEECYDLAINCT